MSEIRETGCDASSGREAPGEGGASIQRQSEPGLDTFVLDSPSCSELFLTAVPLPGEDISAVLTRLMKAVKDSGARIVWQMIFHVPGDRDRAAEAVRQSMGSIRWPIVWLTDAGGSPEMVGAHVHAIRGSEVEMIAVDDRVIGCVYESGPTRYCLLGDLRDSDASGPRADQARRVFDLMTEGLARAGMTFADVLRTWFFNDDILGWYDDFNRVRTTFFNENGVFEGMVPASTGIGAGNPDGAALTAGLVAMTSDDPAVRATAIVSPLQSSALDYGSSFSRAVELTASDHRRIYVSGTASICSKGRTLHGGDVDAQIERTMQVAEAILVSRGAGFANVSRGIAYLRRTEDAGAFASYCADRGLNGLPLIVTCNTVCRDDLLFEIEVEGVVIGDAPAPAKD